MDNTPHWQLWLLAHLPRPLVVLLMMPIHLARAFVTWLKGNDGENAATAFVSVFIGAWVVGGFLIGVADSVSSGLILASAGFFAGLVALSVVVIVLWAIAVIWGWYNSVDESLPRREKKDDD